MKLPVPIVRDFDGNLDGIGVQQNFDHLSTALPDGPGPFLNVESKVGEYANYHGPNSGATGGGFAIYLDSAATKPVALSYTPPVNAWWEVTVQVAIVAKQDAAYHQAYLYQNLTGTPAFGPATAVMSHTQHNSVNTYEAYGVTKTWPLTANVAYTVACKLGGGGGGSYSYFAGAEYLWIEGKAWAR